MVEIKWVDKNGKKRLSVFDTKVASNVLEAGLHIAVYEPMFVAHIKESGIDELWDGSPAELEEGGDYFKVTIKYQNDEGKDVTYTFLVFAKDIDVLNAKMVDILPQVSMNDAKIVKIEQSKYTDVFA